MKVLVQTSEQYVQSEMKKKKKSSVKPRAKKLRRLYYWAKFLGLIPLSLSEDNKLKRSFVGLLYGCFLTFTYFWIFHLTLIERSTSLSPDGSETVVIFDFLAISCQFFECSATWLMSGIFQNRIVLIVTSFKAAEKTSEKLGIQNDWDEQLKEFKFYLLINNILFMLSLMVSNLMWTYFANYDLILWTRFDLPAATAFNEGFIFIWCLIFVRRKFRRLNETVQFLMRNECVNANVETGRYSGLIRPSRCDPEFLLDRLNMISQLHRELRDVICRIEKHFAAFIFFCVGNSLTFLTFNLYGFQRHMKGHQRDLSDLMYFGAISHWTIYPLISMFVISNVCGSTSDEANSTGGMLHKMLNSCNKVRNFREAAKFESLSLDLLQNPVNISAFGLFKLDHFLVYSTVTTAASYLTIMLQLYY